MLPVLLCVAGWGWSINHAGMLAYWYPPRYVGFTTGSGTASIQFGRVSTMGGFEGGWIRLADSVPASFLPDPPRYLGFVFDWESTVGGGYGLTVKVPYWFLVAIFGVLLLLAWRKTRPKPNPATAFPVEVKKSQSPSTPAS